MNISAIARYRRHLLLSATTVLLVIEFVAVRKYFAHSIVALGHANPLWVLVAALLELISMNSFARTQRRMLRATGLRRSLRSMVTLAYEANTLNVTPPGENGHRLRTRRGSRKLGARARAGERRLHDRRPRQVSQQTVTSRGPFRAPLRTKLRETAQS